MAAVTANTSSITLNSAQLFEEANDKLHNIYLQVSEAQETLKSQAMVTTAGANLSRAIDSWTQDLNDIRNTLQQMSAQLRLTAQQLNASNERNTELAASTPVPSI